MTRQYRWQLKQQKRGKCPRCGKPATFGASCLPCAIKRREYMRKKLLAHKRYLNAKSYQES